MIYNNLSSMETHLKEIRDMKTETEVGCFNVVFNLTQFIKLFSV